MEPGRQPHRLAYQPLTVRKLCSVPARRSGSYQARQAGAAHNPALRIGAFCIPRHRRRPRGRLTPPVQPPVPAAYGASGPLPPRWSTWDQSTPTERGPKPHPKWLVTDLAAVDYELGVLKTGKEADVFLLRRGVPGTDRSCLLAAKRYRDATGCAQRRHLVRRPGLARRRPGRARAPGGGAGRPGVITWRPRCRPIRRGRR